MILRQRLNGEASLQKITAWMHDVAVSTVEFDMFFRRFLRFICILVSYLDFN